jgi:hypothetical protein
MLVSHFFAVPVNCELILSRTPFPPAVWAGAGAARQQNIKDARRISQDVLITAPNPTTGAAGGLPYHFLLRAVPVVSLAAAFFAVPPTARWKHKS